MNVKMIVGLGNPGSEYSLTRHNVGFMVVDELARRWKVGSWRNKYEALSTEYRKLDESILLVKPQTYMNLSGVAVGALARWYKISPEDILVVYDDMDLETGRLRLRTKGSSGGHKGMESILGHLGIVEFPRVRLGIGRPKTGQEVVNFVLNRFSFEEQPFIEDGIKNAADAVEYTLSHDFAKAMNQYNK